MEMKKILILVFLALCACAKTMVNSEGPHDCRGEQRKNCGLGTGEQRDLPVLAGIPQDDQENDSKAVSGPIAVEVIAGEADANKGANASTPHAPEAPKPEWDCTESFRSGQQQWTCNLDKTVAYMCQNDGKKILRWPCPAGKFCLDQGDVHYCQDSWQCEKSRYFQEQYFTCSEGNLYKCNSQGQIIKCDCRSRGCKKNKTGCDDECLGDANKDCTYRVCN